MNKLSAKMILNTGIAVAFATAVTAGASAPVLAQHARPAALKTLRWYGLAELGGAQWPSTLDPSQITDSVSYNIANQTQGNLVRLLPGGKVVGDLASGWKISKHDSVYTFTLRSNLKFANGHTITASDVDWSITRALAKSTASPVALLYDGAIKGAAALNNGNTSKLSGIKVLSKTKLRITLSPAIPYFLKTLTYPTADVLDPAVVKGKPAQTYLTNTCLDAGAGQFMFKCRNHKTDSAHSGFFASSSTPSITLVPNRHYYGSKPHINLYMPVIATSNENYTSFQSNTIDVSFVPSVDISASRHEKGFKEFKTSITDYMTPNSHPDSPFHNLHCRLAVAYAINRPVINKDVLHGLQNSTYQVLPGNIPGFTKKFITNKTWAPHYDKARAKSELNKCSTLKKGTKVVIPYQNTSSDVTNEYSAVQAMLQAVGINASLSPLTFNDWLGVVANENGKGLDDVNTAKVGPRVDLTENLWIEDYPDAEDYMFNLLDPKANYDIGYFNNPQYNKLVNKGDTTFNQSKRNADYIAASKIALNQGAWIAIGNQLGFGLVKPNVHGLVGSAAYGILVPKNDLWANVHIS